MTHSITNLGRRHILGGAALSGLLLGFHAMGYHPIISAARQHPT
jgi:hypothetical protein